MHAGTTYCHSWQSDRGALSASWRSGPSDASCHVQRGAYEEMLYVVKRTSSDEQSKPHLAMRRTSSPQMQNAAKSPSRAQASSRASE